MPLFLVKQPWPLLEAAIFLPLTGLESWESPDTLRNIPFKQWRGLSSLSSKESQLLYSKGQLKSFPSGQPIREDGPSSHFSKEGTPTFGAVLIIISIILSTLIWTSDFSKFNYIIISSLTLFGAIGFYDDLHKVKYKKGISSKNKIIYQIIATVILYLLISYNDFDLNNLFIPFLKDVSIELGLFYFLLILIQ